MPETKRALDQNVADIPPKSLSDDLIYFAGMARSGNTVISRELDLHPEVY